MRTYSYRFAVHLTGGDTACLTITQVIHVNGTKMAGRVTGRRNVPAEDLWGPACEMAAHMIRLAEDQDVALHPGRPHRAMLPPVGAYSEQAGDAPQRTR